MRNILIAVALVAMMAVGVGATVSASPRAAKKSAACDMSASCENMTAAECAACPMGCGPCTSKEKAAARK
jgi:hypothetical protein